MRLPDIHLDLPEDTFKMYLYRMSDIIQETLATVEQRKVFHEKTPHEIMETIREPLPETVMPMEQLFDAIKRKVIPHATFNSGPYCNAYVLSCGNQVGVLAEMLAAFLNQNCGKWHLSAIGAEMEKLVIAWVKAFLGLPGDSSGLLVSGGSMANLTCLAVARNVHMRSANSEGLFGQTPLVCYVSTEAHHCVIKGLEFLGLGNRNIRQIPVNKQYMMDTDALAAQIALDSERGFQPFCVVASAGTVNTGAIDDLQTIGAICRERNLWFHIDGAYGAPAVAIERCRELFWGMELADSLAVDPHKWLYVPMEAGCALFRASEHSKEAFSHIPDYLAADKTDDRRDFMEHGIQLSRSFKALKIWMTFKAYGACKLREAIEHDIGKAKLLEILVCNASDFELMESGPLSIVCFRYNPASYSLDNTRLNILNLQLVDAIEQDGRVFITATKLHERVALRACFVNHRAQARHVDYMFEVIRELAGAIGNSLAGSDFVGSIG